MLLKYIRAALQLGNKYGWTKRASKSISGLLFNHLKSLGAKQNTRTMEVKKALSA
jgi:hypothetical protein